MRLFSVNQHLLKAQKINIDEGQYFMWQPSGLRYMCSFLKEIGVLLETLIVALLYSTVYLLRGVVLKYRDEENPISSCMSVLE